MPYDSRPCAVCGGGDDEGLMLHCDVCNVPLHAHCVGFTKKLEGDWLCSECEDQPADSEGHESEEEQETVAAGA